MKSMTGIQPVARKKFEVCPFYYEGEAEAIVSTRYQIITEMSSGVLDD
ncbi:MAG: hypothetical protein NUV80_02620 [Candidatus Berkelbacteria bacterium]|nr:hypothetical protein [Candidatus Berkelbacteria bacterium]